VGVILVGVLGFRLFSEEPTWIDCLYITVTTLTTVGYREAVGLNEAGRVFVVIYMMLGIGVVSYAAFQFGRFLFSTEMQQLLQRHGMDRAIAQLEDHYIVCGLGRMGYTIARHLHDRQKPFVVIDVDEERVRRKLQGEDWLYIVGDATDDQVLKRAGIDRARSLASVLPTDAANVYVVLSARLLSSTVEIISRAGDDMAAKKLKRAGASRVVSPYSTGAVKIARFMLSPNVEDFLEVADQRGQILELADVLVTPDSPYVGKKLMETDLRERGVIIVGIRRQNGERLVPPPGSAVIQAGDCLFAFGSAADDNRMIGQSARAANP
jgi:voltage-gated potassium channel